MPTMRQRGLVQHASLAYTSHAVPIISRDVVPESNCRRVRCPILDDSSPDEAFDCQACGILPMSNNFTFMRLARHASVYWPQMSGPLLTLAIVGLIELLARTPLELPNPPAVLILIVIWAAFRGGMRAGLLSAV